MEGLWKASKIFGVPLTHPYIQNLTHYDLELMYYLTIFEDPKVVEKYKNRFVDDSFNDFMTDESIPINPFETEEEWEEVSEDEEA